MKLQYLGFLPAAIVLILALYEFVKEMIEDEHLRGIMKRGFIFMILEAVVAIGLFWAFGVI